MLPLLLRHDKIKVIFPGYCVQVCKYDNIILYILKHIQLNVLLRSSKYYNYLIIEYHTIYIYIQTYSYHNIHALLIGAASLVAMQTGSKIFENHKLTLSEENISVLSCMAWRTPAVAPSSTRTVFGSSFSKSRSKDSSFKSSPSATAKGSPGAYWWAKNKNRIRQYTKLTKRTQTCWRW